MNIKLKRALLVIALLAIIALSVFIYINAKNNNENLKQDIIQNLF